MIVRPKSIKSPSRIFIGENVAIYEDCWLQAESPEGRLVIGDGAYVGGRVHLHATGLVEIGDGSWITEDVVISDGNHDREYPEVVTSPGPIVIGKKVFIGNGAIILGGVTIGDGARIGARSLVNRDVPAGATVVGVPARVVSA